MSKKISLLELCSEDEIIQLEQLYYESTTKERIVSLALTMAKNPNIDINPYYEKYLQTFIKYDKAKQEFYNKYLKDFITQGVDKYWEINFVEKVVYIYD